MATLDECRAALDGLANRLADKDPTRRKTGFDRTLSCTVRDLDATFAGNLHHGLLTDITRVDETQRRPAAQIRLTLTSDDLIALVDGSLNVAAAWASGRLKVEAGVRDMLRLRSIF